MARYSIPQRVLKLNIKFRKSRKEQEHTSAAGIPLVRTAWDTIDMDQILECSGFKKKGISPSSLVLAIVNKAFIGAESNLAFDKRSTDPVLQAVSYCEHIDNVTLSRFLNDNRYPWYNLTWRISQRLQDFDAMRARSDGYLILDDTIIPKYGKHMEGIHKLKDPSTDAYVLGYCPVNLLYADGRHSYPLGFEFRIWRDETYSQDEAFSKGKLAVSLLSKAIRMGYTQQTLLFDSAYFIQEIIELADKSGLTWIGKSKGNRLFIYEGASMAAKDIAAMIPKSRFRKHKKYPDIRYATVRVEVPGHGPATLVIVHNLRESEEERESIPIKYLVASDPKMHGSAVIKKFKHRWEIEIFHRTVKQSFGLEDYHGRKLCGHIAHTSLVYIAYTLVVFLQICFPSLDKETIGEIVTSFIRVVARVKVTAKALVVLLTLNSHNAKIIKEFQARTG